MTLKNLKKEKKIKINRILNLGLISLTENEAGRVTGLFDERRDYHGHPEFSFHFEHTKPVYPRPLAFEKDMRLLLKMISFEPKYKRECVKSLCAYLLRW